MTQQELDTATVTIEPVAALAVPADRPRYVLHVFKPIPNPDSSTGMMGSRGFLDVSHLNPKVDGGTLTLHGSVRTVSISWGSGMLKWLEGPAVGKKK